MNKVTTINFPEFSGLRCLMMPYVQGDPKSVPDMYHNYTNIIRDVVINRGDIGYLTIDESIVEAGCPHRGKRAKFERAIHTEAGLLYGKYGWGNPKPAWGGKHEVTLDKSVEVILANNIDDSCAIWDTKHENTSIDGDIGHVASEYPYEKAVLMKAGEVYRIGIFTPHESLPVKRTVRRQFLRIVSSGVHGRESYFTINPLMNKCEL